MHRLVTLSGEGNSEEIVLLEQPSAPVLLITSTKSDISCLSVALKLKVNKKFNLNKLGLSKEDIITSAFVNMDFSATSIDDVIGTANLNNLAFRNKDSLFVIEELEFIFSLKLSKIYLRNQIENKNAYVYSNGSRTHKFGKPKLNA